MNYEKTGIAVAGSGCGTFIFSPFVAFLIEDIGWRKTLLVLSGIILNCALFGALFRPPSTQEESESNDPSNQNYESVSQHNNNDQNGINMNGKQRPIANGRNPTVNVISNGNMLRSQSVGHNMATKKHPIRKIQNNGAADDTRYAFSQPLLINSEYENKSQNEGQRRASGTLSRKDIFYQVKKSYSNYIHLKEIATRLKLI